MNPHRSSSSSHPPISPPWSDGGSPSYTQPGAPVMPYVPLPSLDGYMPPPSPHHGLCTPPPSSDAGIAPILCANPTVVRYDFVYAPHSIRMSRAVSPAAFPTKHPAAIPAQSVIYIEVADTGHVVKVRHDGAVGVRCIDIFDQIYAQLARPLSSAERANVRADVNFYFGQRSATTGDQIMRVIDLLRGRTVFKRLVLRPGAWKLQTTTA